MERRGMIGKDAVALAFQEVVQLGLLYTQKGQGGYDSRLKTSKLSAQLWLAYQS